MKMSEEKYEEKVLNNEQKIAQNEKDIEKLQENIGMISVFKEIINVTNKSNSRLFTVIRICWGVIFILSILIFVLITITFQNQKEFSKYREESISKSEIIEMFERLANDE
jgi:hypothetical protein